MTLNFKGKSLFSDKYIGGTSLIFIEDKAFIGSLGGVGDAVDPETIEIYTDTGTPFGLPANRCVTILTERIHQQDVTIAEYDGESRRLKDTLERKTKAQSDLDEEFDSLLEHFRYVLSHPDEGCDYCAKHGQGCSPEGGCWPEWIGMSCESCW